MKQIQLETMQDVLTVHNNWHQDIVLIIEQLIKETDNIQDHTVLEDVYELIQHSPFKCDVFINQETMYNTHNIIDQILLDD